MGTAFPTKIQRGTDSGRGRSFHAGGEPFLQVREFFPLPAQKKLHFMTFGLTKAYRNQESKLTCERLRASATFERAMLFAVTHRTRSATGLVLIASITAAAQFFVVEYGVIPT
ncbi:MAG: hypothetical protein ACRCZF_18485, partial [Gemmataceae bacterium]